MGAGPHAQDAWALERAVFLPLFNATLAEELATVVALHGFAKNKQADAADQRIFQLLVHYDVLYLV